MVAGDSQSPIEQLDRGDVHFIKWGLSVFVFAFLGRDWADEVPKPTLDEVVDR